MPDPTHLASFHHPSRSGDEWTRSTETDKLPTQVLVYGEIAVSILSILIGCWTLEQTRQEKRDKGYKVSRGFCHCSGTWSPLGALVSL